jgi:hypothetical protein
LCLSHPLLFHPQAPTSLVTALTKALCCSSISDCAWSSHKALRFSACFFLPDINRLHHPPPQGGIAMGVSSTGASTRKTTAAVSTLGGASSRSADQEASHNARILVLSASEEESSGYVSLMNCIFSAQKAVRCVPSCQTVDSLTNKPVPHSASSSMSASSPDRTPSSSSRPRT